MSFSQSFLSGMQAREARDRRVRDEAISTGIKDVMTQTPQQSMGFTAEQGDQLRAAAESGQYDVGWDADKGAYTVTPKAGGETGVIAQQGVTDFLGTRQVGAMTPDQVNTARTQAISGVLSANGDYEGALRYGRMAKQDARDDARFTREQQQWADDDEKRAQEKEYQEGRKNIFAQTRFGQNQQEYDKAMEKYQADLATYEANKAAGKPGAAPVMPTKGEYSVGDALADRAKLFEHDAKYGRVDQRALGEFADMLRKTQEEGYESALRLAQSGATLEEVARAYNGSGKGQFDPSKVVSDKIVAGKDGVNTRVIQFNDNGKVRTLNTVAELDALGRANDIYSRHFQVRADKRAAAADGRASANATREQQELEAKRESAVALYKEQNPGASQAQLNAVKNGILSAVPTSDKNDPAEVKLANAFMKAGLAKTQAEALKLATSSREDSPAKVRAEIYGKALAANMGNAEAARTATEEAMKYLYQSGQGDGASGGKGGAPYPDGTRLKGKDGKAYVVKGGVPVPE